MLDLVPDHLYNLTFTCFLIILVIIKIIPTSNNGDILSYESNNIGYIKTILLGFVLIIFLGCRNPYGDIKYFADTSGYAGYYYSIQSGVSPTTLETIEHGNADFSSEWLFGVIRDLCIFLNFDVTIWFIIVATIYILPIIWVIRRLFPGYEYLAFLFWICSFGFYSGGVNGIRNADSISIFILGFTLICTNKRNYFNIIIGLLLCLSSYFIHHSISILIIAFIVSILFVKKTYQAIIIWCFAIIMSLTSGNSLANLAMALGFEERAESYLQNGIDANMMEKSFSHYGFRWDFLIFSSIPIIMGWYVTVKRKIKNNFYQLLLNTYIIANAVWIVFMYAAYTNRFAALSWSLFPFVICYPLIKYNLWPNYQNTITGLTLIGMIIFDIIF